MGLFLNEGEAYREISQAERYRNTRLEGRRQRLKALAGNREDGVAPELENSSYEAMRLILPDLASGTPRVRVSSSEPGTVQDLVSGYEARANRWAKQIRLHEKSEQVAADFLMDYSATLHVGPSEDDPNPQVLRLSPEDVIWDPLAYVVREARWIGHRVYEVGPELLDRASDEPGWYMDRLEQIQATQERGGQGSGSTVSVEDSIEIVRAKRLRADEMAFWELYAPGEELEDEDRAFWETEEGQEITPENGYHGVIYTYSTDLREQVAELRRPRPYRGHPYGPYDVDGETLIPDDSMPVSHVIANRPQDELLNAFTDSLVESLGRQKTITAVRAEDAETIKHVQDGCPDGLLPIKGADDIRTAIATFSAGGATPEQIQAWTIMREIRDRNSGLTDMQRGLAGGSGTATEAAIADSAADKTSAFRVEKYRRMVSRWFERAIWWFWHEEEQAYEIEPTELRGMQQGAGFSPLFVGGDDKEEAYAAMVALNPELASIPKETLLEAMVDSGEARFEYLTIEVEVLSLAKTDTGLQQARLQQQMALVPAICATIAQYPFLNWREWLRVIQETGNYDGLEGLIDGDLLAAYQTALLQGAIPIQPTPERGPTRPAASTQPPSGPRPRGGASDLLGNLTGAQLGAAATA